MAADLLIRSCMIRILFVISLILTTSILASAKSDRRNVHRHLKRLNKTPVKTIKSPDGDIIDCVNIAHQPAFDHALLQNHTIQMRPNFHPEGIVFLESNVVSALKASKSISQLWHLKGICQEGTIPIRRTKRNDVLRASSIERFGKKTRPPTNPQFRSAQPDQITEPGHEYAIVYEEGDKYFGAKARINVWEPKIQQLSEFSLAQFWILSGVFGEDINSIEAGWLVSPNLHGDNRTRLFTYWTGDGYQDTGCYNLLCVGFVQTNNKIALGATINPLSGYGGSQYDIILLVWKDPNDGNWWLQFGDEVLGYWPPTLFSHLKDSATMIQWGGEIVNSKSGGHHTTTEMGSGHFPQEGFGKAGWFRNIQVVDGSNKLTEPKIAGTFTSQSKCYDIQKGHVREWDTYFYYGGPGRSSSCP